MKKLLAFTVAVTLAGGFATTAIAAGGATTEVTTAHAHALMAQHAGTVEMSHTHLHHVINCLVGSKGVGFDAAAGDPCKDQGDGAIADAANDQSLDAKLKEALAQAKAGLDMKQLAAVHEQAAKVAATLENTPAQKSSGGYSW